MTRALKNVVLILPPVSSVTLLLQAEFLCDCAGFPRISFGFFLPRRTLFWYHFVIRIICCHLPLVDFGTCSIKKNYNRNHKFVKSFLIN